MISRHLPNRLLPLLLLHVVLVISSCASEATWQWQRAEAGLPRQVVTLAITADPGDAARLWAGTYSQGGLARSTVGGQTWQSRASGLDGKPIFDLLAQPNGSLWTATRDGLRHSTDGGLSWQPVSAGLTPDLPQQDFTRRWLTVSRPVPTASLKPDYNELTVTTVRLAPDLQHGEFVWDDFQIRHVRLVMGKDRP